MLKHQGKGGDGTTIRLGTVAFDQQTLDELVEQYRFEVEDPDADPDELKGELPLTWDQYRHALTQRKRILKDQARRSREMRRVREGRSDPETLDMLEDEDQAVLDFVEEQNGRQRTPDFDGWVRHLRSIMGARMDRPEYANTAAVSARGLNLGVLVTAPRGWGKSTLLKAILRHAIESPNDVHPPGSVIVLDPHGELTQQIAFWPELSGAQRRSDRLIYIRPGLAPGLTVGLNPLDGTGLDLDGRSSQAGLLAGALGSLTDELSSPMGNMLRNCATVLLSKLDATLRDMLDMMRDAEPGSNGERLLRLARSYPDQDVRNFFRYDFDDPQLAPTRRAIKNRIGSLIGNAHFAGMFAGATSLNLAAAVEGRKVVLVDLSPFGRDNLAKGTAGRLIVSMLAKIIDARSAWDVRAPKPPVLLMIDEATLLAGPEITEALAELRKWGLQIVLAQQVAGSAFTPADRKTLLQNVSCRFAGGQFEGPIADVLEHRGELPPLDEHQFWMKWGNPKAGPQLLNVREDLADARLSCTEAEWAAYVAKATRPPQQGGFYRLARAPVRSDEPPAPPPKKSRRSPPQDRVQHHAPPPRQQSPERHAPPVDRATQPEAKPLGIGSPRRDRNATPSRPLSSTAPKAPDRPVAASRASTPPQVAEKPASRPTANPAGTEPYARLEPFSAAGIGLRLRKQAPAAPSATDPSERPEAVKPARSRRHLRAHKPKRPG